MNKQELEEFQRNKDAVKEAFKEWLDEKYAEFGKWALKSIIALILGSILYYAAVHGLIKG